MVYNDGSNKPSSIFVLYYSLPLRALEIGYIVDVEVLSAVK